MYVRGEGAVIYLKCRYLSSDDKQVNVVLLPYFLLVQFSHCICTYRLPCHLKERGGLEGLGLEDSIILK
jgi:hypothetical protein